MPFFECTVYRTAYGARDIRVEAANAEEATEKALEEAGNFEFNMRDAEYEVDSTLEVDEL